MQVHASSLASSPRSRADYEVMCPVNYRLHQPAHHLGAIAAITVEENNNLAMRRDGAQARPICAAVTANRFMHHPRAGRARNFCGVIGTAVIDDDNFVGNTTWHATDDSSNRCFFIQSGNDD